MVISAMIPVGMFSLNANKQVGREQETRNLVQDWWCCYEWSTLAALFSALWLVAADYPGSLASA